MPATSIANCHRMPASRHRDMTKKCVSQLRENEFEPCAREPHLHSSDPPGRRSTLMPRVEAMRYPTIGCREVRKLENQCSAIVVIANLMGFANLLACVKPHFPQQPLLTTNNKTWFSKKMRVRKREIRQHTHKFNSFPAEQEFPEN